MHLSTIKKIITSQLAKDIRPQIKRYYKELECSDTDKTRKDYVTIYIEWLENELESRPRCREYRKRIMKSSWLYGDHVCKERLSFGERVHLDGKWAYGYYVANSREHNIYNHLTGLWCGVSHKTVGQFVGLRDKNGKEIYEGDILELINADGINIRTVCEYGLHRRMMVSNTLVDIPSFCFNIPRHKNFKSFPIVNNYLGKHDLDIMQIIGNIHENTDLLNKNEMINDK